MPFTDNDICQITTSIWDLMLGLDVQRCPQTVLPDNGQDRFMTGSVDITGAWEGTVAVHCPTGLSRHAASVMFGKVETNVTEFEIQDAVGELANMVSGNLKTLLPSPSFLSLPSVMDGLGNALEESDSELHTQITWDCEGQSLMVTVLEKPCHATL